MDRQRGLRQVVISAFVAAMAFLLTGLGSEIAEADAKGSIFDSDHGSAEAFEKECIANGGTFIVTRWGTECHFANGTFFRCDENGNDCVVGILAETSDKKPAETDTSSSSDEEPADVEAEGTRMLDFLAPGRAHAVRFGQA